MSGGAEAKPGSGSGSGAVNSPADRIPEVAQVLRKPDLERLLRPFLALGLEAIGVFDRFGEPFACAASPDAKMHTWDQLPAEGLAVPHGGEFGMEGVRYHVRPLFAGADRAALAVFAAADSTEADVAAQVDAVTAVLLQLTQSGFATWVTSEMHLAMSESSHLAMQQQNTELRRAVEHLRDLDRLKSNFLATVSHELRTPLTSVIGFAQMLCDGVAGELTEEQQDYAETILARADELLALITQILDTSKLEVGAMRIELASCSVRAMAEKALETVRYGAEKASVTVVDHVPADLPDVGADADKVHQVLVNLLSNALKFSHEGDTVELHAELAPMRRPFDGEDMFGEEEHDAVRISVRDRGVGIPTEQLERVFDAFYQVDGGPTRERGGAGLGLSIVKSLVAAHGGDVWADSVLGVGTTFHFTLPLHVHAAAAVAEESVDDSGEPPDDAR